MTVKVIHDLRKTMEAQMEKIPEMCHKDIETKKKKKRYRVEQYSKWNEKYTRRVKKYTWQNQYQNKWGRRAS